MLIYLIFRFEFYFNKRKNTAISLRTRTLSLESFILSIIFKPNVNKSILNF